MDVSCVAMRKKRARKGDVALSEADTVSNFARSWSFAIVLRSKARNEQDVGAQRGNLRFHFQRSREEAVRLRALRLEFRCSLLGEENWISFSALLRLSGSRVYNRTDGARPLG